MTLNAYARNRRVRVAGAILIIVIIALLAFLYWTQRPAIETHKPSAAIRIAAIINMTGAAAQFDAIKAKTLGVALERLQVLYPKLNLKVEILDAGGTPASTSVAVKKAIELESQFILSGTSPTALAIAAQVRTRNDPIWHLANAANPDFGPPREFELRFWPDWSQESELVADMLTSSSFSSVLLIHSTDPYSESLFLALKGRLADKVEVIAQQFDPASAPDFRPALLRVRNEVDALVIFGLPPGIRALVSQLAEVKWQKPVIGGVNINLAVQDFQKAGIAAPLWLIETEAMRDQLVDGTEAEIFRAAYQEKFGNTPPFHSLYLPDSLYMIAKAGSGVSPEFDLTTRFNAIQSFEGPSGTVTVENDGTLRFPMEVRQVQ